MITRLTYPTFPVLSDVELAEWLRIDAGVDPHATAMILSSATEVVEGITGLTIRQANYQIVTPAFCQLVPLGLRPVQTILTVTDATGATIDPSTYTLTDSALMLPAGVSGPVTIQCTAGYALAALIPDSIRHAIAVILAAGYDSRGEMDDQTMVTVNRLCAGQRWYGL